MDKEIIFNKLQSIFKFVFDNENLEISIDDNPETIMEWDSLMHIQLFLEVEKSFGIKFSAMEMLELKGVSEIVDNIAGKLN